MELALTLIGVLAVTGTGTWLVLRSDAEKRRGEDAEMAIWEYDELFARSIGITEQRISEIRMRRMMGYF